MFQLFQVNLCLICRPKRPHTVLKKLISAVFNFFALLLICYPLIPSVLSPFRECNPNRRVNIVFRPLWSVSSLYEKKSTAPTLVPFSGANYLEIVYYCVRVCFLSRFVFGDKPVGLFFFSGMKKNGLFRCSPPCSRLPSFFDFLVRFLLLPRISS